MSSPERGGRPEGRSLHPGVSCGELWERELSTGELSLAEDGIKPALHPGDGAFLPAGTVVPHISRDSVFPSGEPGVSGDFWVPEGRGHGPPSCSFPRRSLVGLAQVLFLCVSVAPHIPDYP